MPLLSSFYAVERSSMLLTASFVDETGAGVVPGSVVWSLTDSKGNIINSRGDVSVTPAQSIDIMLQNDDLAILSNELRFQVVPRILTVNAIYLYNGENTTLSNALKFAVKNLKYIT